MHNALKQKLHSNCLTNLFVEIFARKNFRTFLHNSPKIRENAPKLVRKITLHRNLYDFLLLLCMIEKVFQMLLLSMHEINNGLKIFTFQDARKYIRAIIIFLRRCAKIVHAKISITKVYYYQYLGNFWPRY